MPGDYLFKGRLNRNQPMKLGVFISGSGTNMMRMYDVQKEFEKLADHGLVNSPGYEISVVFSNNPKARGLKFAEDRGIANKTLSSLRYFKERGTVPSDNRYRESYDREVLGILSDYKMQHIALAGYNRGLSEYFVNQFPFAITNVHPSRDPRTIGGDMNAVQQAIDLGEDRVRSTTHVVTKDIDRGPIIMQSEWVDIGGRDADTVQDELKEVGDWNIFPYTLHLIGKKLLTVFKDSQQLLVWRHGGRGEWEMLGEFGMQIDKEGLGYYGECMERAKSL